MEKTIYTIRIYTRAGHQIDLEVEDFELVKDRRWTAKWYGYIRILELDPKDIEAVVQLGIRVVNE